MKVIKISILFTLVILLIGIIHGPTTPPFEGAQEIKSDIDINNYLFRMIRTKSGSESLNINPNKQILKYLKEVENSRIKSETQNSWVERGPSNVGGRMRTIVVDRNDPTDLTWIAGSASGGIWKTTNGGNTWTEVSTNLPNLSIVTIAQSKSNPNILYAGSGEGALGGGFADGYGVFKSTDGGDSWNLLESTSLLNSADFVNTNRLIINPEDENDIIAATSNGVEGTLESALMRSLDGGASWSKIWEPDSRVLQVMPHPDSFDTLYASVLFRGIAISTDGGTTFTYSNLDDIVNSAGGTTGRVEMAIAPSNSDITYASVGYVNRTGSGLFRSEDMGYTWVLISDPNQASDIDYLIQGEYDNCIVAHPFDADKVFWGGVELYTGTISDQITEGSPNYLGTEQNDTEDFLSFVNFDNGTHFQNRLSINDPENTPTIEIRFGPDKSQLAHRFLVPAGGNAGVPAQNYSFSNYTEVPFEVWDIDSNTQLMVSFRDQERDGTFNLNERDPDDTELSNNREYVYIHSTAYSETPNNEIAVNGGQEINQYLFFWPTLTPGGEWTPNNLPESSLKIKFGPLVFQESQIAQLNGNVHPDHHYLTTIETSESTFKLLSVNDGGVASSTNNGATFTEHESGLNTSQFYSIAKKHGENVYLGGTQDNDVMMSTGISPNATTPYIEQHPAQLADGFDVLWNRRNTNEILISYQRNVINKSTDGGNTYVSATSGLDDSGFANGNAPFISRLSNSYLAPKTVFAVSSRGVWKSTNFADSWGAVTLNSDATNSWGGFLNVEVSDIDPKIVWAGGAMDDDRSIFVSKDRGETFNPVSKFPKALGNVTAIVPHPSDPNSAFLLFSQYNSPKILRTGDLGETWEDISGFGLSGEESDNGFPDIATFSMVVFPDNQKIWVGTELGIYESIDNGASWNPLNGNIPKVLIFDMKVFEGEIVVATYGRGIWTIDLDLEYEYESILSAGNSNKVSNLTIYPNPVRNRTLHFEYSERSQSIKDISIFNINGKMIKTVPASMLKNSNSLNIDELARGTYLLRLQNKSGQTHTRKFLVQ